MCIRDRLRPELDQWKPGEHNGTFRGYQLSWVAAKAGLEFMLNEHVEDAVRERAPFVEKFLKENIETVSYTHLDVYKRQPPNILPIFQRGSILNDSTA